MSNEPAKASDKPENKTTDKTDKPQANEPAKEAVRDALRDAISKVDSPEKADEAVRQLEQKASGQKTADIAQGAPPTKTAQEAAQQVEQAGQAANDHAQKAADVLAETARVIAETKGKESEAVAKAAQEVLNPELHGQPNAEDAQQREYLRNAILKRLKPLDALDAMLFLKVNHLPHNAYTNRFFFFITRIFTGGAIWLLLAQLVKLRNRSLGERAFRETALPIVLSTMMVEIPMKRFFRRRRPFIADIKAVSVGIKTN